MVVISPAARLVGKSAASSFCRNDPEAMVRRSAVRRGSASAAVVVACAGLCVLVAAVVIAWPAGEPAVPDDSAAAAESPAETPVETTTAPGEAVPGDEAAPGNEVESLFDGKSLAGWKATEFGGEGEVHAHEGQLMLETGIDLTGVTSTRTDLPRENYEIELDARRVNGSDFFCGLTFPVGPDYCSLIVGGWGGGVVGLSSLDGMDASENETTLYRELKTDRWYHVRLRVTPEKIEAWLDDEQVADVERAGRMISTRSEVDLSQPLGLASWQTTAALKNIRLRRLAGNRPVTGRDDTTKPATNPGPTRTEPETD